MALFALPFVAIGLREVEGDGSPSQRVAGHGYTLAEATHTPVFWLLAASFFSFCMASTGVVVHFVSAMGERGISPRETSVYFAALSAGSIVGRLAIGLLIDRVFAPRLFVPGFFYDGCGLLVLGGRGCPLCADCGGNSRIRHGAEVDLISFLAAGYFGMKHYGQIYGFLYAVFALGSAVGPPVVALMRESLGDYILAFALCSGAMAISALLFLAIGRYKLLPVVQPN